MVSEDGDDDGVVGGSKAKEVDDLPVQLFLLFIIRRSWTAACWRYADELWNSKSFKICAFPLLPSQPIFFKIKTVKFN